MRTGTVIVAILVLVSYAQLTRAEDEGAPFSVQDLSEREQVLFLEGIAQALTVYDLKLKLRDSPRLYCPPINLKLDARTVWSLADSALTGPHDARIVAPAVIDKLQETFPCDGKSKEEVELERLKEFKQGLEMMKTIVDERTRERHADCLQSASTAFCECLNVKLTWQLGFAAYREIASSTKARLAYDSLSSDDQELVDHVHAIRDECARLQGSP
jgi:hypothetical protein